MRLSEITIDVPSPLVFVNLKTSFICRTFFSKKKFNLSILLGFLLTSVKKNYNFSQGTQHLFLRKNQYYLLCYFFFNEQCHHQCIRRQFPVTLLLCNQVQHLVLLYRLHSRRIIPPLPRSLVHLLPPRYRASPLKKIPNVWISCKAIKR